MKITVFGAGPVGLVTSLSFAELGHQVLCLDIDSTKVTQLQSGKSPIYEPGLAEILQKQVQLEKIKFQTELSSSEDLGEFVFIAVNTPSRPASGCDLNFLNDAMKQIALFAHTPKYIVIKSTVTPGTLLNLQKQFSDRDFIFISNPEFIREGSALSDAMNPDRIVIGSLDKTAIEKMKMLFAPFIKLDSQFIVMDSTSAEFTKYAANIMLAARISMMNEFSRLTEILGGDIENIRRGIGSDSRIGPEFLKAGLGYGGSCFPKDIDALVNLAKMHGESLAITTAIGETNDLQIKNFTQKILKKIHLQNLKTISIWGVSFKPLSNDLREAPALKVISRLIESGLQLKIYDPVAHAELKELFADQPLVQIAATAEAALKNSDALVVMTEWKEFLAPDFKMIKSLLSWPIIFDGRNIYDPAQMRNLIIDYTSVGRPS